jgi:hypothetical protein
MTRAEMIEPLTDAEAEATLFALVSVFDGMGCCPAALGDAFGPGSRASRRTNLRCSAPSGFDPYRKQSKVIPHDLLWD